MKRNFDKESYRSALERIQSIQRIGGWVKFGNIVKEFDLPLGTMKHLIPDLTNIDLDKSFEELYDIQHEHLKEVWEKSLEATRKASAIRHATYHRLLTENEKLKGENDSLRAELARITRLTGCRPNHMN